MRQPTPSRIPSRPGRARTAIATSRGRRLLRLARVRQLASHVRVHTVHTVTGQTLTEFTCAIPPHLLAIDITGVDRSHLLIGERAHVTCRNGSRLRFGLHRQEVECSGTLTFEESCASND